LNQKLDSPKPRGYDLIPHPSNEETLGNGINIVPPWYGSGV
jgi:hypothetical protein